MTACHLCRSDLSAALPVWDKGRTGPLTIVCCSTCTLVQTVPHASAEEVSRYYASGDYRREFPPLPVQIGDVEIGPESPEYDRALDAQAAGIADWVIEAWSVQPTDRIVEYGCGEGRVSAALVARGIPTASIEADPGMRAKAEARGCTFDPPRGLADLVLARHVVEHFADPVEGIRDVVSYGKPGAVVVIEVPAVEAPYVSLSHFFQRPHVVTFSAQTLEAAMLLAGIESPRVALGGNVLVGQGLRSAEEPPAALIQGARWPTVAADVVARLHAWERGRQLPPKPAPVSPLQSFLSGADLFTLDVAILRDEVRRHTKAAGDGLRAFSDLAELYARGAQQDPWHADPWVAGCKSGRIHERQTASFAIDSVVGGLGLDITRPELVLMMGAPGSGKTHVARWCHRTSFMFRLDVDELPGEKREERVAAALVIRDERLARRQNLVIDSTGRDPSIWVELAQQAVTMGYRVLVVHASAPLELCLRRVAERGRETMPEEMIRACHAATEAGWYDVAAVCHGAARYDTSGAMPRLVEAGGCW